MIAFYFQETKKEKSDLDEEERNDYAIEFLHKSLQEYLVSEKIWGNLLELTNKDSRRKKYFIDSSEEALLIINRLLAFKSFPDEIMTNLQEIVSNSSEDTCNELSNRIADFLPDWLEFGLLNSFTWKKETFYLKESIIYNNFFQILTNLVDGKNYFTKHIKLSSLSNKNIQITFKDQILTGHYEKLDVTKDKLDEIDSHIYNSKFTIIDTNLKTKRNFAFNSVLLQAVSFLHIHAYLDGTFYNSVINGSDFISIAPYKDKPDNKPTMLFEQSLFNNSRFHQGNFEYKNCHFYKCTFNNIDHQSFKNCLFESCTFYIHESGIKYNLRGSKLINCVKVKVKNRNISNDDEGEIVENSTL